VKRTFVIVFVVIADSTQQLPVLVTWVA